MPYYMGCLEHPYDSSDDSEHLKNMTVTRCIQTCDDHRYALLQAIFHNDINLTHFENSSFEKALNKLYLRKYNTINY